MLFVVPDPDDARVGVTSGVPCPGRTGSDAGDCWRQQPCVESLDQITTIVGTARAASCRGGLPRAGAYSGEGSVGSSLDETRSPHRRGIASTRSREPRPRTSGAIPSHAPTISVSHALTSAGSRGSADACTATSPPAPPRDVGRAPGPHGWIRVRSMKAMARSLTASASPSANSSKVLVCGGVGFYLMPAATRCSARGAAPRDVLPHPGQVLAQPRESSHCVRREVEQGAAHPLAPAPGLGHEVLVAGQARAGQTTEALVEGRRCCRRPR